eukprot:4685464-Prymnesium_polylepis.2
MLTGAAVGSARWGLPPERGRAPLLAVRTALDGWLATGCPAACPRTEWRPWRYAVVLVDSARRTDTLHPRVRDRQRSRYLRFGCHWDACPLPSAIASCSSPARHTRH